MIVITKEESLALRERFGDEVGITITNKHKRGGRKRYYTEESRRVVNFISQFRNKQGLPSGAKRGL